jgi:hypothetical protein
MAPKKVMMAKNEGTTVFWDMTPCGLVEDLRRFLGLYCLIFMMEDVH